MGLQSNPMEVINLDSQSESKEFIQPMTYASMLKMSRMMFMY